MASSGFLTNRWFLSETGDGSNVAPTSFKQEGAEKLNVAGQ
jgi:hypothetical protein